MEVQIDQKVIAEAVASVVEKGIRDGVGNWETQRAINEAVKTAIEEADLPKLIHDELNYRLSEEANVIVAEVAAEILPSLKVAFKNSFESALVAMVYGLRTGKPRYMSEEEQKNWEEVEVSLVGSKKAKSNA